MQFFYYIKITVEVNPFFENVNYKICNIKSRLSIVYVLSNVFTPGVSMTSRSQICFNLTNIFENSMPYSKMLRHVNQGPDGLV